jgi:hypothetical protein
VIQSGSFKPAGLADGIGMAHPTIPKLALRLLPPNPVVDNARKLAHTANAGRGRLRSGVMRKTDFFIYIRPAPNAIVA